MNREYEDKEANHVVRRLFYFFLFIGIIPLLIIFILYLNNPQSQFLNIMAASAVNIPTWFSTESPLLSKLMGVYCKTALVAGLLWFIFSIKWLRPNKAIDKNLILKTNFFYVIFYGVFIFLSCFSRSELATSGKLLRFMTINDYILACFYISLYVVIFVFTCIFLAIPYISIKSLTGRH